jgi:hypothetical protein
MKTRASESDAMFVFKVTRSDVYVKQLETPAPVAWRVLDHLTSIRQFHANPSLGFSLSSGCSTLSGLKAQCFVCLLKMKRKDICSELSEFLEEPF